MKPGEVYWTQLPTGSGRTQGGRCPSIILQDDAVFPKRSPVVLSVPITSNLTAIDRFPATFRRDPTPENGLTYPSAVLVFQTGAVDRRDSGDRIGQVDDASLAEIFRLLDRLMNRTK